MLRASMGRIAAFVIVATLVACANPSIVQLSTDTYLLVREDHGGIFGSMSKLKAGVISDANAFAASQGKVVVPISTNETPMGGGPAQWARFEYQFRVVDKNDPEVGRVSLEPRPDVVIEKTENINVDIRTKDETEKTKDVYAELIKLDDLRQRGILTDAEFTEEKRKLLEGN